LILRLHKNNYVALSPYLIPKELGDSKAVNIGDGFILRAIERLLGTFEIDRIVTNRRRPDDQVLNLIKAGDDVILAGANQLSDKFSVWPGASAEEIRSSKGRFIPFGIGIHGIKGKNEGLRPAAREQIEAIHERIEFSSWRCPATVEYLERWMPALKGRFLMTGCPVVFDTPLLEGNKFSDRDGVVAVTATERDDFWDRESSTLNYVAARHSRSRRYLVLHQDYQRTVPKFSIASPLRRNGWRFRSAAALRRYAAALGFEILVPSNADEAINFYQMVDIHYGSRLHAHLLFLSQNKRSWLTQVDDRCVGIAESLGFPLVTPETLSFYEHFNFEIVRKRAMLTFEAMKAFLKSFDRP
jgi:hypothetical protein